MPEVVYNMPNDNIINDDNDVNYDDADDNMVPILYDCAIDVCGENLIGRSIDNTITDLEEFGWDEEMIYQFLKVMHRVTRNYIDTFIAAQEPVEEELLEEQLSRISYFIDVYDEINMGSESTISTISTINNDDNNPTDDNINDIIDSIQPLNSIVQTNNIEYNSQHYYTDYIYHTNNIEITSQEQVSTAISNEWCGEEITNTSSLSYIQPQTL